MSPAKLNLHLRVGGVRSDGFHPLHTWMVTIGLFDILNFHPEPLPGGITIECDDPAVPKDERNLIARAAALLRDEAEHGAATGVRVNVAKAIPMGGGLGGGSSNAAAALAALNELWAMQWSPSDLSRLAARLGSDVPFFLNGPSALCTGRGEQIVAIAPPACRWAVLVLPDFPLSTAAVYQRFDAMRQSMVLAPSADDVSAWTTLPAGDLLQRLVNDLEPAAFALRPELARLQQAAQDVAGRPVRMSGSGSTLFTLFDTAEEAETAREEIQSRLAAAGTAGLSAIGPAIVIRTIVVRIAP